MTRRKYTKEILEKAVINSVSYTEVLRFLGIMGGGSHSHITRMIRQFEIDHSHFTHRSRNSRTCSNKRLSPHQIFRILPEDSRRLDVRLLRRALKEMNVEEKCNRCQQPPEWQGKFLRLEINHIDGDWHNCLFENLELICPNCHSQETETNQPHKNSNKLNDR